MAYTTAAAVRGQINKTDTTDDAILTALISAAERTINRFCNRPDGFEADTSASARIYAGSGKPYQFIDECVEVSAVAVKNSATSDTYTSWGIGDYIECSGDPKEPNFNDLPYNLLLVDATGDESIFTSGKFTTRGGFRPSTDVHRGVPTVQVTAKWGFSVSVPADIAEACIMQVARWYKRLQGAMGDALASAELGQIMYTSKLDPDVELILKRGRYIKPVTGRR
jgi:hypothetical protein